MKITDEHIGRLKIDISSKNKIRRDMERRISICAIRLESTVYCYFVDN